MPSPERENRSTAAAGVERASLLGEIAWLMMRSPVHRHLFLADLEWLVAPPLMLRQFRLYRRDKVPVAFVSWALLTEEAEQRVVNGAWRLQPGDWKAGDRLWVVDVVAPHGGLDAIIKDLRERVFPDRTFKLVRPAPESGRPSVEELRGMRVA
jgi:cytolysin-activating lysine-acyltransferase